jgi:hypothetical protein
MLGQTTFVFPNDVLYASCFWFVLVWLHLICSPSECISPWPHESHFGVCNSGFIFTLLPYKSVGKATVLCMFILVSSWTLVGLKIVFVSPVIFKIRGYIQKFPDWVVNEIKTIINTRWKVTQRVMAAKLTRLTHKIAIQLHLVAESCTICSSSSRRPVRKLLDTPSH